MSWPAMRRSPDRDAWPVFLMENHQLAAGVSVCPHVWWAKLTVPTGDGDAMTLEWRNRGGERADMGRIRI